MRSTESYQYALYSLMIMSAYSTHNDSVSPFGVEDTTRKAWMRSAFSSNKPKVLMYRRKHFPSFCSWRQKEPVVGQGQLLLLLLLFLTFSVLVANPKKLLYTVANPARGLLNREKRTKEKVWQHTPPPPPPHCSFGENK